MNDNPDDRFFGYPPETLALIHEFQRTRDPVLVSPVLGGVLAKYLPEGRRFPDGSPPEDALNVLGFESLTLIEIILDLQDALGIGISDDEIRGVQHVEEVRALLARKVAALSGPS